MNVEQKGKHRNNANTDHELHELHQPSREKGIIYKELSYEIVAAAMEVHRNLGPGFTENIYEEAFCRELSLAEIAFERQVAVSVYYEDSEIGKYHLDLLVDGKVIVELKAVSQMIDSFEYQLHAYLRATKKKLGLLFNFGKKSLEYKRIVY